MATSTLFYRPTKVNGKHNVGNNQQPEWHPAAHIPEANPRTVDLYSMYIQHVQNTHS